MINPCCMPLQRGTRIIAIVDMVLQILLIILLIIGIAAAASLSQKDRDETFGSDSEYRVAIATMSLSLAIYALHLGLTIILLKGSNQRALKKCLTWFWITIFLFGFNLIGSIINWAGSPASAISIISSLIGLGYRVYTIVVVHAFIGELRTDA